MRMSGQKGFEGWYFKHQKGDDMVAFIPGRAVSGDFIQLISREGARQFQVSDLTVCNGMIQADRCWFSSQGCAALFRYHGAIPFFPHGVPARRSQHGPHTPRQRPNGWICA